MDPSWMVTSEKVEQAVLKIVETSHPHRVLLFGSYVSGTPGRNSDLDVLVITGNEVNDLRKESIRIRRALKGISMPIDIVVVTESILAACADTPGLIYREALRTGKVVYESAA